MFLDDIFGGGKPRFTIDIGADSIKIIELGSLGEKNYKLKNLILEPILPEDFSDGKVKNIDKVGGIIKDSIKEVGLKGKSIVTGVSGRVVIIKNFEVPYRENPEEFQSFIANEIKGQIPYDISEVVVEHVEVGREMERKFSEILLAAIKKDDVNDIIAFFKTAGLKVGILDTSSFAVFNIFEANYDLDAEKAYMIINIGASTTNIIYIEKNMPKLTRDIFIGGVNFTQSIQRAKSIEDFMEAEKFKKEKKKNIGELYGLISPSLQELLREVRNTFEFSLGTRYKQPDEIFLSGGSAVIPSLDEYFEKQLGIKTQILNPLNKIDFRDIPGDINYIKSIAPQLSTGLGLALRTVSG